jgi:hypothetical protein
MEAQAYEKGTLTLRTDPEPEQDAFEVKPAGQILGQSPDDKHGVWVRRIEILQGLLQKVERYRVKYAT